MSSLTGRLLYIEIAKFLCHDKSPYAITRDDIEKAVSKINFYVNYKRCNNADTVVLKSTTRADYRYFRQMSHYIEIYILFYRQFYKIFKAYGIDLKVKWGWVRVFKFESDKLKFPFLVLSKDSMNKEITLEDAHIEILEPLYNYMKYYYDAMLATVTEYFKSKTSKKDIRESEMIDLIFIEKKEGEKNDARLYEYLDKRIGLFDGADTLYKLLTSSTLSQTNPNTNPNGNMMTNAMVGDAYYMYRHIYASAYKDYEADIRAIQYAIDANDPQLYASLKTDETIIVKTQETIKGGKKDDGVKENRDIASSIIDFFGVTVPTEEKPLKAISSTNIWKEPEANITTIPSITERINDIETFLYYGYMHITPNINITGKKETDVVLQQLHKYYSNIPTLLYRDPQGSYKYFARNAYTTLYLRAWLLFIYMLYVNNLVISSLKTITENTIVLPIMSLRGKKENELQRQRMFPVCTLYEELYAMFSAEVGATIAEVSSDNLYVDAYGTTLGQWFNESIERLSASVRISELRQVVETQKSLLSFDGLLQISNVKTEIDTLNGVKLDGMTYSNAYNSYQQYALQPAVEKYKHYMRYNIVKMFEHFGKMIAKYNEISRRMTISSMQLCNGALVRFFSLPSNAQSFELYRGDGITGSDTTKVVSNADSNVVSVVTNLVSDTLSEKSEEKTIEPVSNENQEEIDLEIVLEEEEVGFPSEDELIVDVKMDEEWENNSEDDGGDETDTDGINTDGINVEFDDSDSDR